MNALTASSSIRPSIALLLLLLAFECSARITFLGIEPSSPTSNDEVTFTARHFGCGGFYHVPPTVIEREPGLVRIDTGYLLSILPLCMLFESEVQVALGRLTPGRWRIELTGVEVYGEDRALYPLGEFEFDVASAGPQQIPAGSWPGWIILVVLLLALALKRRKTLSSHG